MDLKRHASTETWIWRHIHLQRHASRDMRYMDVERHASTETWIKRDMDLERHGSTETWM